MRRLIPILSLLALGWAGCAGEPTLGSTSSASRVVDDDAPAPGCAHQALPPDVTLEERAGDQMIIRDRTGVALCVTTGADLNGGVIIIGRGVFQGQRLLTSERLDSDPMPAGDRHPTTDSDPMPATGDDGNSDPMPARGSRARSALP